MPDGAWVYPRHEEHRGIVEVTSPPDHQLMAAWARAKKTGRTQSEDGSVPTRWNDLAQVCTEFLAEDWALENIAKLLDQPADERHLFLFARSHEKGHYSYRLSDPYDDGTTEKIDNIVQPQGLTDVWFRGRARRERGSDMTDVRVARFQTGSGWHRYVTQIEE